MAEDLKNTGYILHPAKGKIPFFANFATIDDLEAAISKLNSLTPKVVDELPAAGEAGYLYFVPITDSAGEDQSKEYIWVENRFELVGSTGVDLTSVVKTTGDQTIRGIKTFDVAPHAPAPTVSTQVCNKNYVDSNTVRVTGNQNIMGTKTYTTGIMMADNAPIRFGVSNNAARIQGTVVDGILLKGSVLFENSVTVNSSLTIAGATDFNGEIRISSGKIGVGEDGWTLGSSVSTPTQADDGKHRLRCIIGDTGGYFLTHEVVKNGIWSKSPIIAACQWDFSYHSESSILVKIPTTDFQAANKKYVDDKILDNVKLNSALTLEEYDALETKDAKTLYLVTNTDGGKFLYLGNSLILSNSLYFKTGELEPDISNMRQSTVSILAEAPSGVYEIGVYGSYLVECEHSAIFSPNGMDLALQVLAKTRPPFIEIPGDVSGISQVGLGNFSFANGCYMSSRGKIPLPFIGFARHTHGTETEACIFTIESDTQLQISGGYYIRQIA